MKKKIPKKITLDNLEKSAMKYLEKYSASEYQLITILKRKIIKTSFFYKTKPEEDFTLIELIINKFKKIGLINDRKFSENKAVIYIERGFSKKKVIFNLKSKGISDENIEWAIKYLKKSYENYELLSALIFARKKKIMNFKKTKNDLEENKKKLLQMSQAGFSYDIAKKIIDLTSEKEFLYLEKYSKYGND
tara:strand:+ start:327 stop:899 length:573 start_codon:yes stop_codon:yes gene_type:complete